MDYEKQAEDFCVRFGVKVDIKKSEYQSPPLSIEKGDRYGIKYDITISREGKKSFSFPFWDSITNSERLKCSYGKAREKFLPSVYDVLACLTKYDPETFEDFCSEYGYSEDSIKALETFNAVDKEWHSVNKMFGDCLEELQEINLYETIR